jgi:putative transposase
MPLSTATRAQISLGVRSHSNVDYVRVNPKPDAQSVINQLPGWFAHYNEVHPHRALRYRSPREFIAKTCEALSGL